MLISLPYHTVVALNQFIYRRVKCTSRCLKISVNHVGFHRIPFNCKITYCCPPFRLVSRSNVFWSRPMMADLVNIRWDGPCRWVLLVVGAYYTVAELGKMKKVYLKTINKNKIIR